MKEIIENYDVKLERLSKDKIELVRVWRNSRKIAQYMEFQEEITPEMQEKWFRSVDNDQNLYYIIHYKNTEIGLINVKDIDQSIGSGESGVFIYDDKYLNSDISYRAHLCLFDYYFEELGYQEIHAHVRGFNKRASRLSLFLGFRQIGDTENYSLEKKDYLSNRNRERFIRKYNILKNR